MNLPQNTKNIQISANEAQGIKKIGTREMVYKGLALKTSGNLTKVDIELKIINGVEYYISKKISERMKELIKKSVNARRNKKTHVNVNTNTNGEITQNNHIQNHHSQNHHSQNHHSQNHQTHNKTMKNINFLPDKNHIKEVFYKELMDQDIEALRAEAEVDDTMKPPKQFQIETLDDGKLDLDLNGLLE